jgi:hypothetical protein
MACLTAKTMKNRDRNAFPLREKIDLASLCAKIRCHSSLIVPNYKTGGSKHQKRFGAMSF